VIDYWIHTSTGGEVGTKKTVLINALVELLAPLLRVPEVASYILGLKTGSCYSGLPYSPLTLRECWDNALK
jgi:hypothetical protein